MHEIVTIGARDYASRLRVTLSPGRIGGWPRKYRDRYILLHAIARAFREGEMLTEKEATGRIQDFVVRHGENLGLDAVTLRRALIDEGFMDRDSNCRDYRISRRFEKRMRFEGEMPEVDDALTPR